MSSNIHKLDAINSDPFIHWLDREDYSARWLVVRTVLAVAALLLVVNAAQGSLGASGFFMRAQQDIRTLLIGDSDVRLTAEPITFFRDYASLVLFGSLSVWFSVFYHQLRAMTQLLPKLAENQVIDVWEDELAFDEAIDKFNAKVLVRRQHWKRRLAIAFFLMLCVVLAERNFGIYPRLASQSPEFASVAYNSWWAGTGQPAGFVLYLAFGTSCLYYVILQNQLGLAIVRFFRSVSTIVVYRINTADPDGYYGWRPFRSLMGTVYSSILLHGIALSGFFLGFSLRNFWVILPLLAIFIVLNPLYVGVPLFLMRRPIERNKETRIEELLSIAPTDPQSLEEFEHMAIIRSEIALVRRAPHIPFNVRAIFLSSVAYTVPLGLAIMQVYRA